MAENTTDRRVRKTRGQLRQGLVRLMREKSIQDITVKELCEECDINRGTFYLHYTDVYQLLHSIEDELLVEFERVLDGLTAQSVLAAATPSPAMCSMFELLADQCGHVPGAAVPQRRHGLSGKGQGYCAPARAGRMGRAVPQQRAGHL